MEKEIAGEIDPSSSVYPVIRSTSFPMQSNEGNKFITKIILPRHEYTMH